MTTGILIVPCSARVVVLAATAKVMLLLALSTVIAENPAGLLIVPMVKPVKSLSPRDTRTTEETEIAERIVPFWSAGNTYSDKDWVIVYPSFCTVIVA